MAKVAQILLLLLPPSVLLTLLHELVWKGHPANLKSGMLAVDVAATVPHFARGRAIPHSPATPLSDSPIWLEK